jgi:phosphatidylserine/phosphatidylglycerophosphate/cardiolipin synthase-like enzyme
MPTEYINQIHDMLVERYPQPNPLWNYSADNTLAAEWLRFTPTKVWGKTYDQFSQAVVDENGPLHLKTCTVPGPVAGTTELCSVMDASMTALDQTPDKLLIGHSDAIVDAMYDVARSAEVLLDVTSLSPPTGRFLDALNNAVLYLASKPVEKRPVVRILVSNPLPNLPPDRVYAEPLLRAVTKGLDPNEHMPVYVFVMSSYWSSWNHAKIVAADGVRAVVGGHNQWGTDYLGMNPAHDVSMRLTGTAARHSQDFANSMWAYGQWYKDKVEPYLPSVVGSQAVLRAAWLPGADLKSTVTMGVLPAPDAYTSLTAKFAAGPGTGSVPVLAVGRAAMTANKNYLPHLNDYRTAYNEPSDDAIIKMVSLAKRTVRMSLQSLRLIGGWVATFNYGLIDAIVAAMDRGVTFYVVISNPGAPSGGQKHWSGTDMMAPYDGDLPGIANGEIYQTLMQDHLHDETVRLMAQHWHLAQFRYSADAVYPPNSNYPDGEPIGNHAKTVIVDDAVFIIGSQNMYSSNLNEFGYIVEDATAAAAYVTDYWTPLWNYSKVTDTTAVDPDMDTTEQVEATSFIADSQSNTMMRIEWNGLLAQYNATAIKETQLAIAAQMNELIGGSGYFTTSTKVIDGLKQAAPAPTLEALRFVGNTLTDKGLMTGFNDVVMKSYPTVEAADTAINAFLVGKGYKCTVQEAFVAFASLRGDQIAYWQGVFTGWVVNDGGGSYANATAASAQQEQPAQPHALQARAATETATPLPELGPVLKVSGNTVTLDGVAIQKQTFKDMTLTWSSADGNSTSGSLQFGSVLRPTITDTFTGDEFFGTITFPVGAVRHGVYSYYGRVTNKDVGADGSDEHKNYTLVLLATLLGVGLLVGVLLGYKWVSWRRQQDLFDAVAQQAADRDLGPGTGPADLGAQVLEGTAARITQQALRHRGSKLEDALVDAEAVVPLMTKPQAVNLQKNARQLKESDDILEGRTAEVELEPLFVRVKTANTGMNTVGVGVEDVLTSFGSRMSASTKQSLTENSKAAKDIGSVVDKLFEQSETGKELTFGEEGDRVLEI